jgi:hypothetical protein
MTSCSVSHFVENFLQIELKASSQAAGTCVTPWFIVSLQLHKNKSLQSEDFDHSIPDEAAEAPPCP